MAGRALFLLSWNLERCIPNFRRVNLEHLPGFREFYPSPQPANEGWSLDARKHIFDAWRRVAVRYGFREYDGPPLEPLELYTAKSGEEIVGQLFNFTDKGGRNVSLRPEMTPTLARMIAQSERHYKKPIKWFAIPQLFRYEKQQKGRLREHFQLNADIFGESGREADAEIIALLIDVLRELGLGEDDFFVRLSCRTAWQEFFQRHARAGADPASFFQAIDKMERESPEATDRKLAESGCSLELVKAFIAAAEPATGLREILDDLEARGLRKFVAIDYSVIRGLAYYTGPVFEAFDRKGVFRAIAGGGRYDRLVQLLSQGKVDLPGLGFGMGDVVLLELLKARGLLPEFRGGTEVFVLTEPGIDRGPQLGLLQFLRERGISADHVLSSQKVDKQIKKAVEMGCLGLVKVEAGDSRLVWCRNLVTRVESMLEWNAVQGWVERLRSEKQLKNGQQGE